MSPRPKGRFATCRGCGAAELKAFRNLATGKRILYRARKDDSGTVVFVQPGASLLSPPADSSAHMCAVAGPCRPCGLCGTLVRLVHNGVQGWRAFHADGSPHRGHCRPSKAPRPLPVVEDDLPEDDDAQEDAVPAATTTEEQPLPKKTPKPPSTAPAAPGSLEAVIAAAVAPMVAELVDSKTDEARVKELIGAALAELKSGSDRPRPLTITVEKQDAPAVHVGLAHAQFPELLSYVHARVHPFLVGAPGGGKSHAAKQVAEAEGLSFGYVSLTPATPDYRLMGYMDANGSYVSTDWRRAVELGGVFCLDELDNASGSLLTALNSTLANGLAAFPDGMVPVHADFVVIATGNTWGRGAARGHADRRALDNATLDRFAGVRWTYDLALERAASLARNKHAGPWVDWVQAARVHAATVAPQLQITPRASMLGAQLLVSGQLTCEQIAESVVFKGCDESLRTKVLGAAPLPRIAR